jgi:hypothetical protein
MQRAGSPCQGGRKNVRGNHGRELGKLLDQGQRIEVPFQHLADALDGGLAVFDAHGAHCVRRDRMGARGHHGRRLAVRVFHVRHDPPDALGCPAHGIAESVTVCGVQRDRRGHPVDASSRAAAITQWAPCQLHSCLSATSAEYATLCA